MPVSHVGQASVHACSVTGSLFRVRSAPGTEELGNLMSVVCCILASLFAVSPAYCLQAVAIFLGGGCCRGLS